MTEASADQVAKRFSLRPGCQLVSYEEVGICVFAMDLRVIVVEDCSLSPLDQFIIRTMEAGLTKTNEISEFLGIEQVVSDRRLVELQRSELISVLPLGDDLDHCECELTAKGREAAKLLSQQKHVEKTIGPVFYHGLLRKPFGIGSELESELLTPRELRDRDLEPIRAIPQRSPYPEEIDIPELAALYEKFLGRRRKKEAKELLLTVRAIDKGVRRLYLPAVMLVYETIGPLKRKQVGFAVNGLLDEEAERVFATNNGAELHKDLLSGEYDATAKLISDYLPSEFVRTLPPAGEIDKASIELEKAIRTVESLTSDRTSSKPDTREVLREQLAESERLRESERLEAEKHLAEARAKLSHVKVRRLHLYSLTDEFNSAISSAKERLVIVSAFISSAVVNHKLLGNLKAAVERGVSLWIQYGMDGDPKQSSREWEEAAESLEKLRKQFPQQIFIDAKGNTHEKILICDDRFVAVGSFNWLSYPGASARRKRKESALQVFDSAEVQSWFDFVVSRFKKGT
jgi:PLD-like domain